MHILLGVVLCFVLSGFAALLYQTAWMRLFSLVFGTSELAVAAVLAAYMAGLAIGAGVVARYVHRIRRPVLLYGLLEAGIAGSALAVPYLLTLLNRLYVAVFGGQPELVDASLGQSLFHLGTAFVVLAIPTTFMGATLPLLTKYVVKREDQIGSRVGLLYATNTIGAVAGAVATGFVLLPALGLHGTVWIGVSVNIFVFVIAAMIARAVSREESIEKSIGDSKVSLDPVATPALRGRHYILPLMLLSGSSSFIYEVLWTRLLGHVLGGSITAFATMLASFLGGIAVGSAIAARVARNRITAMNGFIAAQFGIALASMVIYRLLPLALPESSGLSGNALLAVSIMTPATLFIGATFPLAVRILARDKIDAAPASARVYSWNTVGAIAGATIAAFILIPALRYEGTIKFTAMLNMSLALAAAVFIGDRKTAPIVITAITIMAVAIAYRPEIPEKILRTSPIVEQPGGSIRFYEVGRSATVPDDRSRWILQLAHEWFARSVDQPEGRTALQAQSAVARDRTGSCAARHREHVGRGFWRGRNCRRCTSIRKIH
ncbi:MAG: fused MFS/spermidine synthase [Gammaproteobacteria bacterium]|nr:fused MFS/spermidine synthase [Gammaproteobacteria bacterium]